MFIGSARTQVTPQMNITSSIQLSRVVCLRFSFFASSTVAAASPRSSARPLADAAEPGRDPAPAAEAKGGKAKAKAQ